MPQKRVTKSVGLSINYDLADFHIGIIQLTFRYKVATLTPDKFLPEIMTDVDEFIAKSKCYTQISRSWRYDKDNRTLVYATVKVSTK